jgi:cytochrome P450
MHSPGFDIDESRRSESSRAAKKDGRAREWDPEDMAVFKPERWLVPASSPGQEKPQEGQGEQFEFDSSAGPQLAFGLGPRGCFGKRLAYLQLRIMVTLILWNFELLSCPAELSGYAAIQGVTFKPRQCYVRLRKVRSN